MKLFVRVMFTSEHDVYNKIYKKTRISIDGQSFFARQKFQRRPRKFTFPLLPKEILFSFAK